MAVSETIRELIQPSAGKPGTVVLAYVHGDTIRPAFMQSVINAISHDRGVSIAETIDCGGLYVPALRNDVVRHFLKSESEWLWFLDSDVGFPPETLSRMLKGTEKGERKILAASYWNAYNDGSRLTWLVYRDEAFYPLSQIPAKGYCELVGCGMGCTLIHRDVFLDVRVSRGDERDPWTWFGHDLVETAHGPIRMGEDLSFCIRARRAGHATWGFCDVAVEHYKLNPQPKAVSDGSTT